MRLSTACGVTLLCLLACKEVRRAPVDGADGGTSVQNGSSGTGNNGPQCVAGDTQECVGPGACAGAQECLPDRSGWSECDCGSGVGNAGAGNGGSNAGGTSAAGTSNGGTGQGGASNGGTGGSLPVGGAAQGGTSTGGSVAGGGTAGAGAGDPGSSTLSNSTVTFAGQASRPFGTYHLSTAFLYSTNDYGVFNYQANEGLTHLQFEITGSAQDGYAVYLMVSDVSESIPEVQRGSYQESARIQTQTNVPVLESCASISTLEMVPGGDVEATFNCTLIQTQVDTPSSMTFTGQFVGRFPQ